MFHPSFNSRIQLAIRGELDAQMPMRVAYVTGEDCAFVCVAALDKGTAGERYIAYGRQKDADTIANICDRACSIAKVSHRVEEIPRLRWRGLGDGRPGGAQDAMRTNVIRTGMGSVRNFSPRRLRGEMEPYQACVNSLVTADRLGHHWALCHDATDWPTPAAAWNGGASDLLVDAPDPNAVFTMDVAIASAAALTENVRFLWGPLDLVRRAHVNIAQSVLSLDHATRGRIAVVLAQGQQNHMRQYGISRAGTRDKLWDGVQIVRKFIRQTEPFSYRGRVWRFDNGQLALPPYGEHPPEVFVAGGMPESLELTGRYADGWVDCIPGFNRASAEVFGRKVAAIREHARDVGRDPDELTIFVLICCVMLDDPELVESALDHPIVRWNTMLGAPSQDYYEWGLTHPYGRDYNYMRDCIPEWISADEFRDVTARTPREAVSKVNAVGTPENVLRKLDPWLDCGVTDAVIYNLGGVCSSEHQKSAAAANTALLAKIKGRPVVRKLPGTT